MRDPGGGHQEEDEDHQEHLHPPAGHLRNRAHKQLLIQRDSSQFKETGNSF